MKKIILFSTLSLGSLVFAQKSTRVLGGDRDVHGCIGSAGYTYSQLRNNCIRTFDQKIKLKELNTDKSYTSMTAIILKLKYLFRMELQKALFWINREKKRSGKAVLTLKTAMFWHLTKKVTRSKKMMLSSISRSD